MHQKLPGEVIVMPNVGVWVHYFRLSGSTLFQMYVKPGFNSIQFVT